MKKPTLSTFAGMRKGDKIIVVRNTNSHNYPMNKILTLKKNGTGQSLSDAVIEMLGNNLDARDCIRAPYNVTLLQDRIGEMEDEIAGLKREVDAHKEILSFCQTNRITEYDPDIIKIVGILQSISKSEEELNDFQKAELFIKSFYNSDIDEA
jgi:hypothetical protein